MAFYYCVYSSFVDFVGSLAVAVGISSWLTSFDSGIASFASGIVSGWYPITLFAGVGEIRD